MVNLSLNQTLMRSLNTQLTAMLPMLSLLLVGSLMLGATTLEEFALALLIVYLVWGTTYFALAVAMQSLPPLLMNGARFVAAGLAMLAIARLQGLAWPTAAQWRAMGRSRELAVTESAIRALGGAQAS